MHQLWQDIDENYDGTVTSTEGSYTAFGHIAALIPYESYTANVMFGFGVFRVGSSNFEYIKEGDRPDLGGTVKDVFLQTGNIYQYKFAVAGKLTRNIAVGGTFVIWDESPSSTEEISFSGPGDSSYVLTDKVTADLDGVSFEFGIIARLSTFLHAGVVFTTPAWLTYQGSGTEYYEGTYRDGDSWTTDPYPYYGEDKYTLPMNFRFGTSLQAQNMVISFDCSYSDYRQTEYNGQKMYYENDPTIDILNQVWSYNLGAEITIPWTALSIRAGYMYLPMPLKGMDEMTYVVEERDQMWLNTDWDYATTSQVRHFYTAGLGYVFDNALAFDFALSVGKTVRSTTWLTETKQTAEFLASAAYRF